MRANIPGEKQIVALPTPLRRRRQKRDIKQSPDGARTVEPLPRRFSLSRSEFLLPFLQKWDAPSPQPGQLSGQPGVRIDCKSHQP